MELKSHVPVAVGGSCSSDSTSRLGTSIYHRCGPKKKKKKRKKKKVNFISWRINYKTGNSNIKDSFNDSCFSKSTRWTLLGADTMCINRGCSMYAPLLSL